MNNFNKPLLAGLAAMFAATVLSSCINEEFSVKNLDTSITVLPELCIHKDVNYELPISRVLSAIPESDQFICDENGDYWIAGKSLTGERVCSCYVSKAVLNSPKPFTLGNMKFAFQFPEEVYSPIYLDFENPTDEPFSLSLTMATITKMTVLSGFTVAPGKSTIILDQEAALEFLREHRGEIIGIARLTLNRINQSAENPLEDGTFKVSASAPVAIMPGERLEYEYDCPVLSDVADNHITLDIEVSVESRVPANIAISLRDEAEQEGFNGTISGFDTIQAGTADNPVITKMVWRIDNPDGLDSPIPLTIDAHIPEGNNTPVTLNRNQTVNIRINSVKFENGIHLF